MPRKQAKKHAVPHLLDSQPFRDRLREAFRLAGLNQNEVAGRLGVRPATVNAWLKSTGPNNLPGGDAMLRLAAILQVNYHWLWTGRGDPKAVPGDAERILGEIRQLVTPSAVDVAVHDRLVQLHRSAGGKGGKRVVE